MELIPESAPLAGIDTGDETYRITTDAGVDDLTRSIETLGVINPPILVEKGGGLAIVSGFRRLKVCKNLGWQAVQGRILPKSSHEVDRVRLAVTDNAFQRPLNLVELSRSLHMLHTVYRDPLRVAEEAPSLGLPDNPSYINKVRKICRLPQPVQRGILTDSISLSAALEIGKMNYPTAVAFAELFNALGLSMNKQRELLTWVREISLREDITAQAVLEEDPLPEILNGDNPDRGHRAREVGAYLKQRRFPSLTKAEDRLKRLMQALKLGSGLSLKPPPHFEGTTYKLEMTFTDIQELTERKNAVERALENPVLRRILD